MWSWARAAGEFAVFRGEAGRFEGEARDWWERRGFPAPGMRGWHFCRCGWGSALAGRGPGRRGVVRFFRRTGKMREVEREGGFFSLGYDEVVFCRFVNGQRKGLWLV